MEAKKISHLGVLLLVCVQVIRANFEWYSPIADEHGRSLRVKGHNNDGSSNRVTIGYDKNGNFVYNNPLFGFTVGKYYENPNQPEPEFKPEPEPKHKLEPEPEPECRSSITKVRDKERVCSGTVIFEENFRSLDTEKWQVHQYIPLEDYGHPFVSYQPLAVSVKSGKLRIRPMLLEDIPPYNHDSVYMDTLDLRDGCTVPEYCFAESYGSNILPPVVSGKITSKDFAFTYGVVEIRAKMPVGDWLYPELHLEPLMLKYGRKNHESGIMKIAGARGNSKTSVYSTKMLYAGLIATSKCKDVIQFHKSSSSRFNLGDDYHIFKLEWRPDEIVFYVDGERWASTRGPLRSLFDSSCDLPAYASDSLDMAPFDHHFYISFSVAAGGTTEFPDRIFSSGHLKPWRNAAVKAKLNFWQDLSHWRKTWIRPDLVVDYVKVTAL